MEELIFIKLFDDVRSVVLSALNWFLEIEYQEVHDILEDFQDAYLEDLEKEDLEDFEEEDDKIACSYEDYEAFQKEQTLEKIKKKEDYCKAIAREEELNDFTLESLEKRVFSNTDILMIQWLLFLLKDSNDAIEMEMKFEKCTLKIWDIHLCFGKTIYEAFEFYEYHLRKNDNKFVTVYYKAVLKENRSLYFYGFKDTIFEK